LRVYPGHYFDVESESPTDESIDYFFTPGSPVSRQYPWHAGLKNVTFPPSENVGEFVGDHEEDDDDEEQLGVKDNEDQMSPECGDDDIEMTSPEENSVPAPSDGSNPDDVDMPTPP
jgi:hypothetical protein